MINQAFNHERVKKMKLFTKPLVEYNLFKCHWRLFLLDPAKLDNEHPRYRRQLKRSMTDAQIVSEANDSKIAALRKTIETRFSKLCRKFNVEHTLSRGLTGLQLRIEQIVLSYNLDYFEIN